MSGSPEVVQALPPSRSRVAGSTRANRGGESGAPELDPRPSSGISKVAWAPRGDLGQSEWLATGRRLGAIGRCSQWWIGDWIRYGTARWGERYVEAARVTGYDVATLRNMAWVASQFDVSLRSDKLTWSHHVLLAPLDPDEQRRWLEHAQAQRLSVADLRTELRRTSGAEAKALESSTAEARSDTGSQVCPHCGHALGKSAD
jgi:hypothetical protein